MEAKQGQQEQETQAANDNASNEEKGQQEQEAQEQETKYTPDPSEKNLYHVQLEKPLYDKNSGKKLSLPFVQKFTQKEYNDLTRKKDGEKSNAELLGYQVTVLWDPTENLF